MRLMKTADDITGPVNLGNPSEFAILELAETVIELTGSNSEIQFNELPDDDPQQRRPDITLAKKLLDWEPRVGLKEDLSRAIEYFDKLLASMSEAGPAA